MLGLSLGIKTRVVKVNFVGLSVSRAVELRVDELELFPVSFTRQKVSCSYSLFNHVFIEDHYLLEKYGLIFDTDHRLTLKRFDYTTRSKKYELFCSVVNSGAKLAILLVGRIGA